jgi:hypothetical protein
MAHHPAKGLEDATLGRIASPVRNCHAVEPIAHLPNESKFTTQLRGYGLVPFAMWLESVS